MDVNATVTAWWPVLIGGLFVIVWLVRLEAKVLNLASNKKEVSEKIEANKKELSDKFDKMHDTLFTISNQFSKLEGRIDSVLNK